jgi:hypothetical protein
MEKKKDVSKSGLISVMHSEGKLIPIIIVAVVGIALLLIGGVFESNRAQNTDLDSSQSVSTDAQIQSENLFVSYEAELEEKIRLLCTQVGGVGEVRVSVYINEMFDYVSTGEADSPYLTLCAPKISGIGIVCDGGNDPNVKKELTMLVSTAFSVGSNKIYITGT